MAVVAEVVVVLANLVVLLELAVVVMVVVALHRIHCFFHQEQLEQQELVAVGAEDIIHQAAALAVLEL
jgi:hypothetical protein